MDSSSSNSSSKLAPFPTKFRLKYSRSATGCLSCRRRRKKCDETRPQCISCQRNNIQCAWPERIPPNRQLITRPKSPINPTTPCTLTDESSRLLQHYLCDTAVLLPTGQPSPNPFIVHVLPMAQSDNILMHAVLAVSGAHLCYKCPDAAPVKEATLRHYAHAIQGIHQELASFISTERKQIQRITAILAFICQYEILSGSSLSTLSMHLGAIGNMFGRLKEHQTSKSTQVDDIDQALGFIYEGYRYLVLCNSITETTGMDNDNMHNNNNTLNNWHNEFLRLQNCNNFGVIFAGTHDLFEMIPHATDILNRRVQEQISGAICPSPALISTYNQLKQRIDAFTTQSIVYSTDRKMNSYTKDEYNQSLHTTQRGIAAECIRRALRIYTTVSLRGSTPSTCIFEQEEEEIEADAKAVIDSSGLLHDTPYGAHILWSQVIAGSCLLDPVYQSQLATGLSESRYGMRHLAEASKILSLLWREDDPQAYGPYGLNMIMNKYNVSLSIM